MSSSNLLKNIISKDINIQKSTIENLIKTANIADFKELCQNSDFIFPHIKERITKNFIKLINKNDLETIFKFSMIYSFDFEDLIVKSWVKFADEDLTDSLLILFENGTQEQKAYCAKYFSHIKDPLCLDYLKKYALSEYEPLKINCAIALSSFGEDDILEDMKNLLSSSANEFDKIEAYKFLCGYNTTSSVQTVLDNCFESPFRVNIVTYLLDFCDFENLTANYNENIISKIFNVLIEGYPEDIGLDTIGYYRIYDFIKYLLNDLNPYNNNLLAIAKSDFKEYLNNENYHFNLDKNSKNELREIVGLLEDFKPDFSKNSELLHHADTDYFKSALKVIEEYQLSSFSDILSSLINNSDLSPTKKAYIAQTLKALNKQNLIKIETINNIENDNVKTLIESLMI